MTKNFPVKNVPLSDIKELQENYWFDCPDGPQATCINIVDHIKLIEACDLKYPIILCANGTLMDGMHRVCKAYLKGDKTIKAVQFDKDPEPHYINVNFNDLPYDD